MQPKKKLIALAMLGLIAVSGFSGSASARSDWCAQVAVEKGADQLIGLLKLCVGEMQAQVVPQDAVIAFDSANGCPNGWTEFSDAAGRTIIGQGSGMVDENGKSLSARKHRQHGGEEKVTLNVAQLPEKRLRVLFEKPPYFIGLNNSQDPGYTLRHGGAGSGQGYSEFLTEPLGEGQPHNNMPPYVALYFCKKE